MEIYALKATKFVLESRAIRTKSKQISRSGNSTRELSVLFRLSRYAGNALLLCVKRSEDYSDILRPIQCHINFNKNVPKTCSLLYHSFFRYSRKTWYFVVNKGLSTQQKYTLVQHCTYRSLTFPYLYILFKVSSSESSQVFETEQHTFSSTCSAESIIETYSSK